MPQLSSMPQLQNNGPQGFEPQFQLLIFQGVEVDLGHGDRTYMGKVLRIIGKVWGKLKTWNKKKDLNMKVWTS
jgi:hypothetical protein